MEERNTDLTEYADTAEMVFVSVVSVYPAKSVFHFFGGVGVPG